MKPIKVNFPTDSYNLGHDIFITFEKSHDVFTVENGNDADMVISVPITPELLNLFNEKYAHLKIAE